MQGATAQKTNHFNARPRPGVRPNKPFKAPSWSHQRELSDLKGKKVHVLVNGAETRVHVTILEVDQFTLKVRHEEGATAILFKHSIAVIELDLAA